MKGFEILFRTEKLQSKSKNEQEQKCTQVEGLRHNNMCSQDLTSSPGSVHTYRFEIVGDPRFQIALQCLQNAAPVFECHSFLMAHERGVILPRLLHNKSRCNRGKSHRKKPTTQ